MSPNLNVNYKSSSMKKWLTKLEQILLFALPVVIFFAYFPVIKLGSDSTMNFELSLPLIWLAIFGVISLFRLPAIYRKIGRKRLFLLFAFPIYLLLSVFWSANPVRGILTAGIFWLICLSAANLFTQNLSKTALKQLLKIYLISSVAAATFCLIQCILDVSGVARDYTLLCAGCTYRTFGFTHPNGFAIEPQFMGNLLIAPCIIAILVFYQNIKDKKGKCKICKSLLLSFYLIMVLYVIFSRGALYAFGIAMAIVTIYNIVKERSARALLLPTVMLVAFGAGLLFQGILAELSPTTEGFADGIARSVNQISLGKIDFRAKTSTDINMSSASNSSTFNGYVEESTDTRLNLNDYALQTWSQSPKTIVFGVGLGGAGVAMHEKTLAIDAKEIVQNEYLSILLELGLVGIFALLVSLNSLLWRDLKERQFGLAFAAICLAYLLTFGFFAGLPNVLHIYLFTPVLYLLNRKKLI